MSRHALFSFFSFFFFPPVFFQSGSGICPATAVQNKMFPTTDAALMWNVRQQQNNLRFCTDHLVMYLQNPTGYRQHVFFLSQVIQENTQIYTGQKKSTNTHKHLAVSWESVQSAFTDRTLSLAADARLARPWSHSC